MCAYFRIATTSHQVGDEAEALLTLLNIGSSLGEHEWLASMHCEHAHFKPVSMFTLPADEGFFTFSGELSVVGNWPVYV